MKKLLVNDIRRIQALSICLFTVLAFFLTCFLIWNHSVKNEQKRLLQLSNIIGLTITKNQHLAQLLANKDSNAFSPIEKDINELIRYFPKNFSAGFYSRRLDKLIFTVSNDQPAKIDKSIVLPSVHARIAWQTQRPQYSLTWSSLQQNWIIQCDNPVIIDGSAIGHTFAYETLPSLIDVYWELGIGLVGIFIFAGIFAMILSSRATQKIQANIDRLLLNSSHNPTPEFQYSEFEKVAQLNQLTFAELNLAKDALRKSTLKLTTILGSISDAFFVIDQNWHVTFFNQKSAEIWGFTHDSIGKTLGEVYPQFPETIFYDCFQKSLSEQIPYHFETFWDRADRWFEVYIHPSRDGLAISYHDITQRKNAESESRRIQNELVTERERLLVTLSSIGDGVIATNQRGEIVLMNKTAESITGYSNESAIGKPFHKIFYVINAQTSESYDQMIEHVLQTKQIFFLNAVLVTHELEERQITLSCAPITSPNNEYPGTVIVFQDVTENHRIETELLKSEKLESLGILAGGIAHDFNNILAAILANIQLSLLKLEKGDDPQRYLKESIEITHKANSLTKQLLTFSRGGAPVKQSASIAELIQETVNFVLRGSKIKCLFDIPTNLWSVEIDKGQISQVIQNLVINAKQAMARGGRIEINAANIMFAENQPYRPGKYVKLIVKDHGSGIPKEHLSKIFDPFFTTKKEGTGLGLSTSYSIIKQHDGYIEVQSQEGVGTVFEIHLPAGSENSIEELSELESATTGEGLKIILMDDEEMILKVVGEMLTYFGYHVTLARDGREVIEYYSQAYQSGNPFDAVILDLTVPGGIGGREALPFLRDIDPYVKAIVSSGYANDPIITDYERYGFCGVVTKPYKFGELNTILNQTVERKQLYLDFGA